MMASQRNSHAVEDPSPKDKDAKKRRKEMKKERKEKKEKRRRDPTTSTASTTEEKEDHKSKKTKKTTASNTPSRSRLPFDHEYILAPMVGASELAFRLLTRKYGVQLAYTPMMSSVQFVRDPVYRHEIFPTNPLDRPLVCHFSANTPTDFAHAVRLVEGHCDAVDLNLGCPQRTAFVGHFGSYLLDPPDRSLICDMIRAGVGAVTPPLPIFVKIRLLATLAETIELCQQLQQAGVSLIAIHARHRASWERQGPGARDGPALLDWITAIQEAVPSLPIVANGNVLSYDDVVDNFKLTRAKGIMSAEGILDNPALFLPRWGSHNDDPPHSSQQPTMVTLVDPLVHCGSNEAMTTTEANQEHKGDSAATATTMNQNVRKKDHPHLEKKQRKLVKKLREIEQIQTKVDQNHGDDSILEKDQRQKLAARPAVEAAIQALQTEQEAVAVAAKDNHNNHKKHAATNNKEKATPPTSITVANSTVTVPLSQLYATANDKIAMAMEYLQLAHRYGPTSLRTQIFHIRRMMKDTLDQYQLLPDCLQCTTPTELWKVVHQCQTYRDDPNLFVYDRTKAQEQAVALERKRHEEGKRKAYEARMIRKAKREGKMQDLEYYLRLGATVPTQNTVTQLRAVKDKKQQLHVWAERDHSQHCLAFHLTACQRGRACAFLHVDAASDSTDRTGGTKNSHNTSFEEQEEVAG